MQPARAGPTRRATAGLVTLTQANCAGEISVGAPSRTADQRPRVCLTGGAAATGHGAPRGATESPPGVVTDRPWICRPVGRGRGKRPRPATTLTTVWTVLLSEAPSYILSGLGSDRVSSKNVQVQICHPNGHFWVWETSIKSRSGPPPVWTANLTFCVGTVLGTSSPAGSGRDGGLGRARRPRSRRRLPTEERDRDEKL
jgi:hypothetical protein